MFSLKIMKAGRAAVQAMAPTSAEDDKPALRSEVKRARASKTEESGQSEIVADRALKPGSKRALILDLLHRKDGATIHALMDATGWLPHTTRAALTGLHKSGFAIERSRDPQADVSVYRIEPSASVAAA